MLSDERFQLSLFREEMRLTAAAARDLVAALRDLYEFPASLIRSEENKQTTHRGRGRVVQIAREARER
jgi:hypothetical protein